MDLKFRFDGCVAPYLRGVIEQWLLPAPAANPGMFESMSLPPGDV
jgi:hypothetical protein